MTNTFDDLSVVYYTANTIPEKFMEHTWAQLQEATNGLEIIVEAINPDVAPSHVGIYKQALAGAKRATTPYIALCEDDVLYSPEHFRYRPKNAPFAYNMNFWNIFTWEPLFTQKPGGRRNLGQLICERQAFIDAMEERFAKYPDDNVNISNWAEPGKYERNLGVTIRETEAFQTNPPNIMFSHETALSYGNLGRRKRLGEIRATEIPHWGKATEIAKYYA